MLSLSLFEISSIIFVEFSISLLGISSSKGRIPVFFQQLIIVADVTLSQAFSTKFIASIIPIDFGKDRGSGFCEDVGLRCES